MATGTILLPVLGAKLDPTNPPGLTFSSTLGFPGLAFDAGATNEEIYYYFRMPENYSSSPVLNIQWHGNTAISGDVKWACQVLAVTGNTDSGALDSETFDSENPATASTVDSHAGTTADRLHDYSLSLTNNDSLAADDYVILKIYRDSSDITNDTYANDATVVALSLEYTTT